MASRFLFQKLVSRMSRSTSLLGAHVSTPVTSRASPARYLSTLHCTRDFSGGMKPALVDCVRAKQSFPSSTSAKHSEHKLSDLEAEREAKWEAVRAAYKADLDAWNAKKDKEDAAFSRFIAIIGSAWCLIFLCWNSRLDSGSSHSGNCEGQKSLHCCKCQTSCSESHC